MPRPAFVEWVAYLGAAMEGQAVLVCGPIGEPMICFTGSIPPEPLERAAERQMAGVVDGWVRSLRESLEVAMSMGTADKKKVRAANRAIQILEPYRNA